MHWEKLVQGSRLFVEREPGDRFYWEYMNSDERKQWQSPDTVTNDTCERLIRFLNQWATRSPLKPAQVRTAFVQIFPALESLRRMSLVDLPQKVRPMIAAMFETVAGAGLRYESTATSKMLHTWAPDTFIMWDAAIAAGYGISGNVAEPRRNGRGYADRFLPRVQEAGLEAIETYVSEKGSSKKEAIKGIVAAAGRGPLAKLIDEYNYVKYTLSLDELWLR